METRVKDLGNESDRIRDRLYKLETAQAAVTMLVREMKGLREDTISLRERVDGMAQAIIVASLSVTTGVTVAGLLIFLTFK